MKDRFKFRCWDKDRKCFLRDDEFIICPDGEDSYFNADYDLGDFIVEQCTGLEDKNGKFIYEGDLIKSPNNNNLLEVVWEKGVWQTKEYREKGMHELFLYILATEYGVEIVGNIHEKESK